MDNIKEKVDEITAQFNSKLKQIDINEITTHMRLMEYRRALFRTEKHEDAHGVEEFKKNFFERAKTNIHIPSELRNMDELEQFAVSYTKNIANLINEYRNAIKRFYQENDLYLYTVRGHKHNTITRSKNIVNQYEAEKGDWVFAASTPKSRNAYRIRSAKHGMIGISDNESIALGDIVHVQDGHLLLNTPAYYYTLMCDKFMPVVQINNTREDATDFRFVFGEEWTSDEDIQPEDMVSVEEYTDVTDLLDSMQLFSTTDEHTVRTLIDTRGDVEKKRKIIRDGIIEGAVTYWNSELNRSAIDFYSDKEPMHRDTKGEKSKLLESAIQATEEDTRTGIIKKMSSKIKSLIKNVFLKKDKQNDERI